MSLTNKIALVTGAAQGLGKAFSQHLLKCGASVAMMDLQPDVENTCQELQNTFGEDKVAAFVGNITKEEDFKGVFQSVKDKFGGINIVINNAGLGGEGPDSWERTIDVNVKGTIRGTLLAFDCLRKDKGGQGGVIVNVASMAGLNPNPSSPTYCASKSAIIQYSLSWANNPEMLANGVRLNVLAPAFIDTPLLSGLTNKEKCMMPEVANAIVKKVGIMSPESVAETTMELIDEDQNRHGQVLAMMLNGGNSYHSSSL